MSRPLCEGRWELFDSIDRADHRQAKELCRTCPIFDDCRKQLALTLELAAKSGPNGSQSAAPVGTWAGQLLGARDRGPLPRIKHGTVKGAWTHRNRKLPVCAKCKAAEAQHLAEMRASRTQMSGNSGQAWENEASPRRHANAVAPGALTDQTLEGVIG